VTHCIESVTALAEQLPTTSESALSAVIRVAPTRAGATSSELHIGSCIYNTLSFNLSAPRAVLRPHILWHPSTGVPQNVLTSDLGW
jgi:hypothetical protein